MARIIQRSLRREKDAAQLPVTLKRLLANAMLENEVIKEALQKKW